ncbi:MAG: hypothetical protein UW04_C0020G0004 [Parcubacteria group bacterium GW2011_GWB1_43_8]|nr:MAG: hypothetical protein UW04_C0020G0004 [Parcubacteria group bacterium GW2011_GWB1_43_8]
MSQVHRRLHNKKMLRKIITYFLIVAVVLPVFASLSFSKTVFAQTTRTTIETTDAEGNTIKVTTVEDENQTDSSSDEGASNSKTISDFTKETKSPCSFIPPRLGADCLGYLVSQFLYYTVFSPSYYIALMAGGIFNASIGFSLSGESFPTDKDSMIATGWKMVRDLLNLFFIFILLYIAISTILQYGNVAKGAIVKIIIAAVLINFSLMMTKMIIDSSHILAWSFYDKIEERQITDKNGDKTTSPIIPEEITVKGITTKNLAGVFMAGFNPQRLLIPSNTTKDSVSKGASEAMADGSGILGIIWQAILIMIMASALNFIVAFILFAGAIMFIIRVVVLWFTLLFSPLAFAGMIMPAFQKYSGQWWDALIKQSFFAPAFLFLFYLVTKMVNSGFLDAVIKGYKDAPSAAILFFDPGSTIVVFFHFFVIGALLVGCLYLAQQMGAHGASTMMKWGNKAGDWAKSKASGIATSPLRGARYGLRYGGGVAGDAMSEGKGWFSRTIRAIPGANIGLRKLGAMKKADEDKARKAAEKYAGTLSSAGRVSLDKDKERGFVGRVVYGGGLSKPTREGYEKVIAKKRADKYEEEKYRDSLAILAGIDDGVDSNGKVIKKELIIKGMLDSGEKKKLYEKIEQTAKNIEDANKKAVEAIESSIAGNAVDLAEQNSRLYKAIEDGTPVDAIKDKILKLKIKEVEFNGQKTIMAKKEKEREAIEKAVEKYENKQETEKLGAKFTSSGAGGGGKGGGGGGKTTP